MPAIVETWFGGVEEGNATADVLFGAYNPGGKLPVTFPRATGQVPIYYAHREHRPAGVGAEPLHVEVPRPAVDAALSVRLRAELHDLHPRRAAAERERDARRPRRSTLRCDVTNTGTRAGDEVVQLYLRDDVASVARPVQELRGFQRVHLAPSESRTVHFALDARALAFHDTSMTLVAEPGTFTVAIGPGVMAASGVKFRFETADGASVPVSERCVPPRTH